MLFRVRTKFVAKIILVHPALIVQKKPSNEAQELFSLLAASLIGLDCAPQRHNAAVKNKIELSFEFD